MAKCFLPTCPFGENASFWKISGLLEARVVPVAAACGIPIPSSTTTTAFSMATQPTALTSKSEDPANDPEPQATENTLDSSAKPTTVSSESSRQTNGAVGTTTAIRINSTATISKTTSNATNH
ncbi:hypothetical protein BDR26DRAFT_895244 [Obelidium mucronatum]|nr:hypothetical protein BDR26DRAFT_895244 [Obelidium mucronatum]